MAQTRYSIEILCICKQQAMPGLNAFRLTSGQRFGSRQGLFHLMKSSGFTIRLACVLSDTEHGALPQLRVNGTPIVAQGKRSASDLEN
jgi:hypothetical protein